jgi:3',5'-cyclic-AMP phosphodiesterase
MPGPFIAQISDPHLRVGPGDSAPAAALGAAVAALARIDPAPIAVLLTGDLAENGSSPEYERLRALLEPLAMPVHPLAGNHDDRDALRAAFSDHDGVAATTELLQYTVRCGAARVVVCDTSDPGQAAGRLSPDRLSWLESELRENPPATIVAMHHPPLLTGMREFDEIGLPDADRAALAQLLRRAPGVAHVVAGHVHRTIIGRVAACPVFVCPSVYAQAVLDLREQGRIAFIAEPPGFALHVHGSDGGVVSHVQPIGDYGPTFDPFGDRRP